MNDIAGLTRFRKKCLEAIYNLSQIDNLCQKILIEPDQQYFDELIKFTEQYQGNNLELQNYLMDFMKSIVDESDEITSTETEEGYRL